MTHVTLAGGDYDHLPYPSMPFPDTQPERLAAIATLFGITPPEADRARVLELGCASGGNIIPLAARFPDATFTGIDLSRRHVDDGRKRITELGLGNVQLRQADLTSLALDGEQFDYVICNGVFSWVPKPTQDAIFRVCQQSLSPNGVVTISYNVLPGWHLRMVVRDIAQRYAGTDASPRRRVAKVRAALESIADAADEAEPYGVLLRTEARRLRNVPSAYILGEFLAPDNAPCYVGDFIRRAGENGLDYLCEADLCAAVPQTLNPAAYRSATSFDGGNRAAIEQHIDFVSGRPFRRSVLVRSQPPGGPKRDLSPKRLRRLHVSSPVRLDAAASNAGAAVFRDERARPITISNPAIRNAILRLEAAYPATVGFDELVACASDDPSTTAVLEPGICRGVFALVLANRVNISTLKLPVGRQTDDCPRAWAIARAEAASGQPWITSLRHIGLPAHPVLRALLPLLDGSQNHAALRARLAAVLQGGTVQVPELSPDQPAASQADFDAVVDHHVEWALGYLTRNGFFEAVRS